MESWELGVCKNVRRVLGLLVFCCCCDISVSGMGVVEWKVCTYARLSGGFNRGRGKSVNEVKTNEINCFSVFQFFFNVVVMERSGV